MSKSFDKTVAATLRVLACVPADVNAAKLDVGQFRDAFKLTSEPKKKIAATISDILTLSDVVAVHGHWCIAELEHPRYQLNREVERGTIEFHKSFDPILVFYDDGLPGEDDGEGSDTEDEEANKRALDEEKRLRENEALAKAENAKPPKQAPKKPVAKAKAKARK